MSEQPQDAVGNPIPVLGLIKNLAQQINITATTTKNLTKFDDRTKVVTLYSTINCFIESGDNTIEATTNSHYLPAGQFLDLAIQSNNHKGHLAVIRDTADGTLYISERG